jgi:DNA-binding transcriptional ArsR family regulator
MGDDILIRSFAALADPVRCEVIEQLGAGPASAGELAHRTGSSPSSMSRHLKVLLDAAQEADDRSPTDARVRMFHLRTGSLAATAAWLDQVEAHWRANLDSFRAHVEKRIS